jgi:hypothetical protein
VQRTASSSTSTKVTPSRRHSATERRMSVTTELTVHSSTYSRMGLMPMKV